MLFGGLGSLMYQIREKTGLFYNAFGQLGFGPTDNYRVNIMCIPVDPTQIEHIKNEVKSQMGSVERISSNLADCDLLQAKQQVLNTSWKPMVCQNPEALIETFWEHGLITKEEDFLHPWKKVQEIAYQILDKMNIVSLKDCISKLVSDHDEADKTPQFVPTVIVGP
jgi:hypothetical protein